MNIAIMLLHYNIPEATEKLYKQIDQRVKDPKDIVVIDNGSEEKWRYPYANLYIQKNAHISGGILLGLDYLLRESYSHYWALSASTQLDNEEYDPLERLVKTYEHFSTKGTVGIIQPSYYGNIRGFTHQDVHTNWTEEAVEHTRAGLFGFGHIETVRMYINRNLPSSWGIDDEMPYLMKKDGLIVLLHHGVRLNVVEGHGVKWNRYRKDNLKAIRDMDNEFTKLYGENWWDIIVAPHCRADMKKMVLPTR